MMGDRREGGSVCSRWGRAFFALWSLSIVGSYGKTEAGVWRTDCAEVGVVGPSGDPSKPFLGNIRGTRVDENVALCDPRQFVMIGRAMEQQPPSTEAWSWQGLRGPAGCYVSPGAMDLPFMKGFCDGSSLDTVAGGKLDDYSSRSEL